MYEERLRQKRITLPNLPEPLGTYLSAVRSGNILFVSGMLPKNSLRKKLLTRLKIYSGPEHPHSAQINTK